MSEDKKEYKIEGRPSTIFRTKKNKDNPYVMVDRRTIDNPVLSFKAKGILTYLLSRPDGWEVSITDLVRHGQEGEAAIRSGMKELREAGHMVYETSRAEGRITGWLIRVFEVPQIAQVSLASPDSDFQQVENLQVENQDVENRTQVLSTLSSNEIINISADISKIIRSMEQCGMLPNSQTASMVGEWIAEHTEEWIVKAIQKGVGKNQNYVDKILISWKANGYPKTRQEQIDAARAPERFIQTERVPSGV